MAYPSSAQNFHSSLSSLNKDFETLARERDAAVAHAQQLRAELDRCMSMESFRNQELNYRLNQVGSALNNAHYEHRTRVEQADIHHRRIINNFAEEAVRVKEQAASEVAAAQAEAGNKIEEMKKRITDSYAQVVDKADAVGTHFIGITANGGGDLGSALDDVRASLAWVPGDIWDAVKRIQEATMEEEAEEEWDGDEDGDGDGRGTRKRRSKRIALKSPRGRYGCK